MEYSVAKSYSFLCDGVQYGKELQCYLCDGVVWQRATAIFVLEYSMAKSYSYSYILVMEQCGKEYSYLCDGVQCGKELQLSLYWSTV